MKIAFSKTSLPRKGAVAVLIGEGKKLSPGARQVDEATKGQITRALKSIRFDGKSGETATILAPTDLGLSRVILAGIGKPEDFGAQEAEKLGGNLYAAVAKTGDAGLSVLVDADDAKRGQPVRWSAHMAQGALLRSYRFDTYRTEEKPEDKPTLNRLTFLSGSSAAARRAFSELEPVANGVMLTRQLISEPPNVLYPETFAERCTELTELGLEVEVLDRGDMEQMGMGSLLGVAQGSIREPRLVVMQWRGGRGRRRKPICFVGKGVTFDTGGISLKPAAGMEEMKWDMGGAGVVTGLMAALAGRKARVDAVGVIGLVENMPDGNAQRPGDIVKSMSGKTIEIINTDAEGRLVLADALWYTEDRFQPEVMINLATLTGAIIISLGNEHAGLFSNNDELAERLTEAGLATDEKLWRMPMGPAYDKMLDTDGADMKNTGERGGGSITAAQFLKRFVRDAAWAHLDIAGVTWSKKDKPTVPRGGTGFGVRLLDRLVADYYEK